MKEARDQLDNTLSQLREHLTALDKALDTLDADVSVVDKLIGDVTTATDTLKQQLEACKSTGYSYEFYEETALLIHQISSFRLDAHVCKTLSVDTWKLFNHLVDSLTDAVYQHEVLTSDAAFVCEHVDLFELSVEDLNTRFDQFTKASKKADQAADEGVAVLEKLNTDIENAQAKSGGLVPDELMEKLTTLSSAMYAKNAAAIIVMDREFAAKQMLDQRAAEN